MLDLRNGGSFFNSCFDFTLDLGSTEGGSIGGNLGAGELSGGKAGSIGGNAGEGGPISRAALHVGHFIFLCAFSSGTE